MLAGCKRKGWLKVCRVLAKRNESSYIEYPFTDRLGLGEESSLIMKSAKSMIFISIGESIERGA
jgi:hypothetical protein